MSDTIFSVISANSSSPAGPDCLPDNDKMDRPVAPVTSSGPLQRPPPCIPGDVTQLCSLISQEAALSPPGRGRNRIEEAEG